MSLAQRRALVVAATVLAVGLRLWRAALRWDEIALAYAAYQQPWVDAAASGDALGMLQTFVGLHPPLYSALYGALELVWGAPAGWLILSALLSAGAVAALGWRFGPAAALALALDPLQLAYGAEINNYPLMCLVMAGLLSTRDVAHRGGPWWPLAVVGALAAWTHVLAGVAAGLCALTLLSGRWRASLYVLGVMALASAPLAVGVVPLLGAEGTYGQAGLDWAGLGQGLWAKAGWALLAVPVALGAVKRARWEVALLVALVGLIFAALGLGIAAAHQQPYWLLLGAPVAACLGRLHWGAALGAAVVYAGVALPGEVDRTRQLQSDLGRTRAIDVALTSTVPGDALWLLCPAWQPDDDKTATSDVLWRLSPWARARPWRQGFEFSDYKWGQPRTLADRVVHSSTDLHAETVGQAITEHHAQGRAVWFVLYDHGYANDYPGMMRGVLEPWTPDCVTVGADVGMGTDVLCHVPAR